MDSDIAGKPGIGMNTVIVDRTLIEHRVLVYFTVGGRLSGRTCRTIPEGELVFEIGSGRY